MLEKNEKNLYWNPSSWTYDAKTFGWDDLYIVSKTFENKWKSFVSDYLEDYGGEDVISEYNAYIDGGFAVKADGSK